jgi:hypothetical protein
LVGRGTSQWPTGLTSVKDGANTFVDHISNELKARINEPISLESLSKQPWSFIPSLAFILEIYEKANKDYDPSDKKQRAPPRLFSLFPIPSFYWRHCKINARELAVYAQIKLQRGYRGELQMFKEGFDLKKLGIPTEYVLGH